MIQKIVVALLFITPLLGLNSLMEPWHFKWFGFYLAAGLAAYYLSFQSKFEIPSGLLKKAIVILIIARISSYALFPGLMSFVNAVDAIALFALVLFFVSILRDRKLEIESLKLPFAIVAASLAVICIVQFFIYRVFQKIPDPQYFSATFGNINMLLEYQNFLYPFLFFYVRRTIGFQKNLLIAIATLTFLCMLVGASRSALIAVILYLGLCVYRRKFAYELVSFAIAVALYFSLTPFFNTARATLSNKNTSSRVAIYTGSLKMLSENPLGYGADGFDFNYTPYQLGTIEKPIEMMHYESPHSEFLKWGIEGGWLLLVAQLFFWSIVLWGAIKKKFNDDNHFLVTALLIVTVPQMLFQFPFELGASSFMLALVFALHFSREKLETISNPTLIRFGMFAVAAGLLVNCFAYTTSNAIDKNFQQDFSMLNLACKIYPNNWHACISAGREKSFSAQPTDALAYLKPELKRRPFNWVALKLVSFTYFQAQQKDKACEFGVEYSLLMDGIGEGPAAVGAQCIGVRAPVVYSNPKQFETDYRAWMNNYLAN